MSQASGSQRWDSTAHGPVSGSVPGPASGPVYGPAPGPVAGPVHASYSAPPGSVQAMPLLDLITRQSMDADYQHVAERRARQGEEAAPATRTRRARSMRTIVAVIAFGLLVTVAAVQTSRNASVDTAGKDELIARINARRAAVAAQQQQISTLRAATTRDEARYGDLGRELSTATSTEAALRASTGWGAVSGPGVRARISDAPNGSSDGEVRDSDLAGLVNGLWQAGATAVSVNGQRVTALSALRNTASVVRINNRSLSPPYTVLALGDTRTLQAGFAQTTSGQRLRSVARTYGMPFTMHDETNLTVPAAPSSMLVLRHARTNQGQMKDKETP